MLNRLHKKGSWDFSIFRDLKVRSAARNRVEPKIQVGDYTSRRDGNTFYGITIRNAILEEGRTCQPAGVSTAWKPPSTRK